ncbi:MAG: hypothetical protein ACODAC_11320 [Pseudomonadota bacterium]
MKSPDPTNQPRGNGDPRGEADAGERVRQTGQEAVEAAKSETRQRLEQGKSTAADTVASTSEALDEAARSLSSQGQETLAQAISTLSGRLSGLAGQLESRSVEDLTRDASRLARANPAIFVAGSVALGVALSRFFKASAPEHRSVSGQEQNPGGAAYGGEAALATESAATAAATSPSTTTGSPGGRHE